MKQIVGMVVGIVMGVVFCGTSNGQECHGSCSVGVKSDVAPMAAKVCPDDMIRVSGSYCPEVSEKCLRWLDHDQSPTANSGIGPLQCAEFEKPTKCLSKDRKQLDFCMSEYEYPGEGTYPLVGMDYYEAKKMAEKDGNRLCTVEEFNFACEGEDIHPYGYGEGYVRDDGQWGCNIDKEHIDYNKFPRSSWNDPNGGLYQGVRSEANTKCRSWARIAHMNGNVDEILDSEKSDGVILSGGYWSKVRDRCRPKTEHIHSKQFAFYQVGFRECSNVKK